MFIELRKSELVEVMEIKLKNPMLVVTDIDKSVEFYKTGNNDLYMTTINTISVYEIGKLEVERSISIWIFIYLIKVKGRIYKI